METQDKYITIRPQGRGYECVLVVPQDDGTVWIQQHFGDFDTLADAEAAGREWASEKGCKFA